MVSRISQTTTRAFGATVDRTFEEWHGDRKNLADFACVGDGSTDDTTGFAAAVATGLVNCRPGDRYRLTSAISTSNQDVLINGNGATLYIDADFKPLAAKCSYTNTMAITNIATTTVDFSDGASKLSDVTVLTVADASAVSANMMAKILSDDLITGEDPAGNYKRAEFVPVASVDTGANTITLRSVLRNTYTTNPRVTFINMDRQLVIRDLYIEVSPDALATWSNNLFDIIGYYRPIVENVRFVNLPDRAVRFIGCFQPITRDLYGENIRTSLSNDAFGYLIHEVACAHGRHFNPTGNNVRHVYTCSAISISGDNNIFVENYGGTYGTKVFGGTGVACQAAAFDTHSDGEEIDFIGCGVDNTFWGPAGASIGIQLRGRRCRAIACTTKGATGVAIYADYAGAQTSIGHQVIDHTHYFVGSETQDVKAFNASGQSGGEVSATIVNPRVFVDGTSQPAFEATFGALNIINPRVTGVMVGTGTARVFEANENGTIRSRGGSVDLTGSTGTSMRLSRGTHSTARIDVELDDLTFDAGKMASLFDAVSTAAQATVIVRNPSRAASGTISNSSGGAVLRVQRQGITLTANSATPSVAGLSSVVIANTSATTITNLANMVDGQVINGVIAGTSMPTFDFTGNANFRRVDGTAADWTPAAGDRFRATMVGTVINFELFDMT